MTDRIRTSAEQVYGLLAGLIARGAVRVVPADEYRFRCFHEGLTPRAERQPAFAIQLSANAPAEHDALERRCLELLRERAIPGAAPAEESSAGAHGYRDTAADRPRAHDDPCRSLADVLEGLGDVRFWRDALEEQLASTISEPMVLAEAHAWRDALDPSTRLHLDALVSDLAARVDEAAGAG